MQRKNILKACGRKSGNKEAEASQVEIGHSGCSIMNLPSHILAEILFKLQIKEIIACKSVCKSWYAAISKPEFANQHYAQFEVFPIARTVNFAHVSRILYLLELQQDERSMDSFSMKLDSKLKLPVRNFAIDGNEAITLKAKDHKAITLKAKDHKYKVVNTCNGFICLSEPLRNKPLAVCNPVTGEFINLPQVINEPKSSSDDYFNCGFGFTPKTNQYKVVIMYGRLAQVHILGTGSWKTIEFGPYSGYILTFPTYLNGVLHWISLLDNKLTLMVSFDCKKECFLPFSTPPLRVGKRDNVGMGVLGGCLSICDSSDPSLTCVWMMKNHGAQNSWTQVFAIDMDCCDISLYGLYQPIKFMDDGALLMFNYPMSVLTYYDPRKPGLKLFEFGPVRSKFEVVAYTPSFISLKDVLAGCNVEVLNVYSRCDRLKLKGEARAISLYEKKKVVILLSDSDSDSDAFPDAVNLSGFIADSDSGSDSESFVDPDYEFYLRNTNSLHGWEEYWWGKY